MPSVALSRIRSSDLLASSGDPGALRRFASMHGEPRHHLCQHHPDACLRHGAVPLRLCSPTAITRCARGRHPSARTTTSLAFPRPEVRRHLCSATHIAVIHSAMRENFAGLRQDDPWVRARAPLWRPGHHGRGRGRRAGKSGCCATPPRFCYPASSPSTSPFTRRQPAMWRSPSSRRLCPGLLR